MFSTSSGALTERSPISWRFPGVPLRCTPGFNPVAPSVLKSTRI